MSLYGTYAKQPFRVNQALQNTIGGQTQLYNPSSNGGMPQYGDFTMAGDQGTGSLFGDFNMDLGGMGDLMSGIGGLYGMYLGKQQLDDVRKTNKHYRGVTGQQQNQRSDFLTGSNQVFGNPNSSTGYNRFNEVG